jgi:hypothetical protein
MAALSPDSAVSLCLLLSRSVVCFRHVQCRSTSQRSRSEVCAETALPVSPVTYIPWRPSASSFSPSPSSLRLTQPSSVPTCSCLPLTALVIMSSSSERTPLALPAPIHNNGMTHQMSLSPPSKANQVQEWQKKSKSPLIRLLPPTEKDVNVADQKQADEVDGMGGMGCDMQISFPSENLQSSPSNETNNSAEQNSDSDSDSDMDSVDEAMSDPDIRLPTKFQISHPYDGKWLSEKDCYVMLDFHLSKRSGEIKAMGYGATDDSMDCTWRLENKELDYVKENLSEFRAALKILAQESPLDHEKIHVVKKSVELIQRGLEQHLETLKMMALKKTQEESDASGQEGKKGESLCEGGEKKLNKIEDLFATLTLSDDKEVAERVEDLFQNLKIS